MLYSVAIKFNIFSYNHIIFRTTTLAADYVTFEMVVSETFIGGLIGRCGSNISRIRIESGATIKVGGLLVLLILWIQSLASWI